MYLPLIHYIHIMCKSISNIQCMVKKQYLKKNTDD